MKLRIPPDAYEWLVVALVVGWFAAVMVFVFGTVS
jgi:hypothetical protein